jgi:hypothetical protein
MGRRRREQSACVVGRKLVTKRMSQLAAAPGASPVQPPVVGAAPVVPTCQHPPLGWGGWPGSFLEGLRESACSRLILTHSAAH